MLQELAAQTGASFWVVASMLFFIAFYAVIAVRVFTTRKEELDAQARLALDDEAPSPGTSRTGAQA